MAQVVLTAGQALAANAAAAAATAATAYATNQAVTAGQNALFGPVTTAREGPLGPQSGNSATCCSMS